MASVGDKVRVLPNKAGQPPRDGVVTGVSGSLLRVRWSTGEESSFIPGAGSVTVIGKSRAKSTTKKSGVSTKKAAKANPVKKTPRGPKK
jgi:hypothetical protein